ncbi:non-ribosomal peptide synthetase, partial [Pseudoalteromonas amylolytica]|uniref:non-ribosomal peptide synthetase n=2 Tax=Pseudoalteromonas TaxID=53246 RepID=UPI000B164B76
LPILSEAEQHHLVHGLNNTKMDYPKDSCIHELFEQQAQATPDKVAVEFGSQQLTYGALNRKANQLAHYLVNTQGVTPDTLVGLCVERSLEMIVGMLGILKAGGAYVPLDPNYPQARLDYMIEDAGLVNIVSHQAVLSRSILTGFRGEVINLDAQSAYEHCSTTDLTKSMLGLSSENLAYVIYTSGSTGQPKGVMLPHQGAVNLSFNQHRYFETDSNSRVLHFASISFDAATWECLMAFMPGATLCIADQNTRMDAQRLFNYIHTQRITHATLPPALLKTVQYRADLPLQCLIVAGESCDLETVKLWRQHYRFFNAYGPSEASVCATIGELKSDNIHIGTTLYNVSTLVLDAELQLVSAGSIGELFIGGDGLARGYLNRPQLSAERFIANPFYDATHPNSSERLYRTGDLVRYLPDGNLEFIGRVDDQVKIRGFRIELGEVEAQLAAQAGVDSALVMAKELAGAQQLVGYIQANGALDEAGQRQLVAQVKESLANCLPDYMVPSVLMVVNTWPLTANGKIDKKALPQPDGSVLQGEYVGPCSEAEDSLVRIFSQLLDIDADKISTTANFFELGGHSLLSIRLISL